jgi:hypothetical protein
MFLFRSCNLLDPASGELRDSVDTLVEGDRFKEVSDRPIKSADATTACRRCCGRCATSPARAPTTSS